ncbi:MAG: glutamine synthetase family protein [Chloroflexota bacterium]
MTSSTGWTNQADRDRGARIEHVVETSRDARVEFVHLQFIDIPGAIKGLTVPVNRLVSCLTDGMWFDGSSVEGLARVAESDLYLLPDPDTFAIATWEGSTTARLVCNLVTPGNEPFPADPRFVLARALADAAELGFSYRVGAEVEFFLFEDQGSAGRPLDRARASITLRPSDARSYFELPDERAAALCQTAVKILRGLGYHASATHHEAAPGQHEIDLDADDAPRTADAIVTLKLVIRSLAHRSGLLPTFMPKPIETASGSGLHLGQEVLDRATGQNALVTSGGGSQLSPIGQHFVAGQLAHARGMCAILAPLVNSYKRLLGGDEAPANVSWGRVNRGALLRVSEAPGLADAVLEARAPDPSCNPYLALAVLLQAGLDGVREETPLPSPDEQPPRPGPTVGEAGDPLPSTLGEAIEELGWDMVVRSALGQPVFERFMAAKEREWLAYRHHISSWELESYLETA